MRNILRSPRQEGELTDTDYSNQEELKNPQNEGIKNHKQRNNEGNGAKEDVFEMEDMEISIEEEEFLEIDDDLAKQIMEDVDKEDEAEARARVNYKNFLNIE